MLDAESRSDCLGAGTADTLLTVMALDLDVVPESDLSAKTAALATWLRASAPVAIGFSGGVDSAYLAVAARELLGADRVLAIIGRSASYPAEQWATARDVARRFDVPVLELDTDELDDPRYAANPSNRCYFCKSELWGKLVPAAKARGFRTVIGRHERRRPRRLSARRAAAREHGVAESARRARIHQA